VPEASALAPRRSSDPFNDYLVTRVPLGLFSDGFESGDTSAWSATVP
jgi:hypothetical protein